MSFVDTVKKNIDSLSVVATFAVAVAGGALAVESRYAKAADIDGLKNYVQQARVYDRWEQRRAADLQRKQQVEDQLFILRLKQTPSTADRALVKHYEDSLMEVNGRLNQPSPPPPAEK